MHIQHVLRARSRGSLALLAVLALGACSDRIPTTGELAPPAAPASTVRIDCRADVRAGSVQCGEAGTGGARGTLILGGQGTYVRLASSGTSYDPALQVLSSDVTVRNLLAQAMGTTTGADTAGVRVFFDQLPTVTAGTGSVEVANEDGTEAFTASAQPYFHYGEIIAPQGASLPKRWEFSVPPTVETFVFTVLVQTSLHDEGAPLRWTREVPGAEYYAFAYAAWSGGSETFVVGDAGLILRHDGTRWTRMASPNGHYHRDVWGASPRAVFAAGALGSVWRFDGNRWTADETGTRFNLNGVWGSSASNVMAVGQRGTIVRWNGAAWAPMASNTRAELRGVWGASASEVMAVGTRVDTVDASTFQRGVVLRYDGAAWTESVISTTEEYRLTQVAGRGPAEVYATGSWRARPIDPWQGVVLRWDGAAWTRVATAAAPLLSLSLEANGEILATGDGPAVLRFDGQAWSTIPTGFSVATAFRLPNGSLWVGGAGTLYRREGDAWVPETPSNGLPNLSDVWAFGASRAVAVGEHQAFHWNGSSWMGGDLAPEHSLKLADVWGRAADDVYAVGAYDDPNTATAQRNGGVAHWDGLVWTLRTVGAPPAGREEELEGVWGAPDGAVFAAGLLRHASNPARADGLVRRLQDGEWPVVATVAETQLYGVWASSSTEVWAGGRRTDPATGITSAAVVRVDGPSPTTVVLDPYAGVFSVWGSSPTDVYAAGYRWSFPLQRNVGAVWHYDGKSWTVVAESGSEQLLMGIHGSSATDVYAVGIGGTVLHFNGASWQPVDVGSPNVLEGVHALSRGDVFVVGWSGEFLRGRR